MRENTEISNSTEARRKLKQSQLKQTIIQQIIFSKMH